MNFETSRAYNNSDPEDEYTAEIRYRAEERLNYTPTAALGDLALRFILGGAIGSAIFQPPIDSINSPLGAGDLSGYSHTLEMLSDTVYVADRAPTNERH